jgi:hypothetical protein
MNGAGVRGMRGSAELQLGRAVLLIVAALIVGILVLHRGSSTPAALAVNGATSTTVRASHGTTTTTPTTAALRNPQDIKVLVANGTDTRGAASLFSDRLHKAGYNTLASTNTTTPAATSTVFYAPGYDREAAVVATQLGLQPSAVQPLPQQAPVAQLHDAQILVVVGPDLSSSTPATTSGTTATTVHRTTTTAAATTTTRAVTTTSRP